MFFTRIRKIILIINLFIQQINVVVSSTYSSISSPEAHAEVAIVDLEEFPDNKIFCAASKMM